MTPWLIVVPLMVVPVVAVILGEWLRDLREERQEAERRAAARHPSRRAVPQQATRRVPGRYPDGEPLSEDELKKYTGLMFREAGERGNQAPETSADEGA